MRHFSFWLLVIVLMGTHGIPCCHAVPVLTNESVFYVPFNLPKGPPESLPQLVELFVSGDRGKTWDAYQQRAPQEGRFSFQAAGDGAYYFATRTVDRNGQPHPPEITRPELVVIVDKTQPQLHLHAQLEPDGRITIAWEVRDTNLAPDQFSIRYRIASSASPELWQPIDARRNSQLLPDGGLQGSMALWPPAGSGPIEVLAEAKDRAKNVTRANRAVTPSPHLQNPSRPVPALPLLAEGSPPLPSVGPVPPRGTRPSTTQQTWGSEHAPQPAALYGNHDRNPNRNDGLLLEPPTNANPKGGAAGIMQPNPPVARQPNGAPDQTQAPTHGESPTALPPGRLGPSSDYRISKTRRFHLDYDIETGNHIDVYRVEVWFTNDGGRTWRHLGDDEDRQSPFLVNVANDGMYGFRLVVQAKSGLAGRPPHNGDPADVWVLVDSTAPSTQLTSARFGRGKALGTLQITWDVHDDELQDQPITLLYSGDAEGPWRRVASDLPNTGRYDWHVDDRTPDYIFLRLEALDRAGNLGVDTLREPIRSSDLAPRGVIHGIRPAAEPDNGDGGRASTPTRPIQMTPDPSAAQPVDSGDWPRDVRDSLPADWPVNDATE